MVRLDIVIPVYDEPVAMVVQTVMRLRTTLAGVSGLVVQIIVVDDGSPAPLDSTAFGALSDVRLLRHDINRGYGAALKTGIKSGDAPWIGIVDADGTYPVEEFAAMCANLGQTDMVIGVRTGDIQNIPRLRRLPKTMLNVFASYLANERIVDLNSGMRLFRRELAEYLWDLFPSGFSFTSTLTMGALLGGFRVIEHPVNYYKRVSLSSIRPIRDTLRFFHIVTRLGLMFSPAKVFGPVAAGLFIAGAMKGLLRDYPLQGHIGNLAMMLMLSGVQIAMLGMLGELIVHSRKLKSK